MSGSGSNSNKHGLTRDIPDPIKRHVRQYCGFGCVNCEYAYCEYHHFEPPFAEALVHDPNKIMLLCIKCHGLHTRGVLSAKTLLEKYQNPFCRQTGVAQAELDVGSTDLEVVLGAVTVHNACRLYKFTTMKS